MPLRMRLALSWFHLFAGCFLPVMAISAADTNGSDKLPPYQTISTGAPPQSPSLFDPDPNKLVLPANPPSSTNWSRTLTINSNTPPAPPPTFNPDPGASLKPAPTQPPPPFFRDEIATPPLFTPPV